MKRAPSLPARDLKFQCVRASGPGGQNVNKLASAVQLRFDLEGTQALPERTKERLRALAGRRLTADGAVLIAAHTHRTQVANRREALARLETLIERASLEPKRRIATRASAGSHERRLQHKRAHQRTKRLRASVGED